MDIFDSRYYKTTKICLCLVGLWVFQTKIEKFLGRCLIFFSLFFTIYIKLLQLVKWIQYDWKLWSSGMELKILHNYAKVAKTYTIIYAGYIYVAVSISVILAWMPNILDIVVPLNESRPRQLVFPAKYPFDSEKYMNLALIHGSFTAFYNYTLSFSTEAMLAISTQHACGLFAIISYRLQNVLKIVDTGDSSEESKNKLIYREISFSIQYHNYAIRYSKVLESMYSPFLFFTMGVNIISTSFALVQVVNSLDNMGNIMKYGSITAAAVFHVYLLTSLAQSLIDESTGIADKMYKESWYDMPEKSKKLMILIILQSYRPCKLTAGRVFTLDMLTFSQMLKASMSYFTLCSQLYDENIADTVDKNGSHN